MLKWVSAAEGHRFVINVNNLHTESYRVMGSAGKAILVISKSVF